MPSENQISIPDKIIVTTNAISDKPSEEIFIKLTDLINELIIKDFQALLQLLYRIDVDEKKIRYYVSQKTNEDSASVLAGLIIERQLQKIESRKIFNSKYEQDKTEEERW